MFIYKLAALLIIWFDLLICIVIGRRTPSPSKNNEWELRTETDGYNMHYSIDRSANAVHMKIPTRCYNEFEWNRDWHRRRPRLICNETVPTPWHRPKRCPNGSSFWSSSLEVSPCCCGSVPSSVSLPTVSSEVLRMMSLEITWAIVFFCFVNFFCHLFFFFVVCFLLSRLCQILFFVFIIIL